MKNKSILLLSVLLLIVILPSINAFLDIKTYDQEIKTYQVRDWLGMGKLFGIGNNFDVQLVKNTDYCDTVCYADLKLHFYNDYSVDNLGKGFETEFYDRTGAKRDAHAKFYIWDDYSYECPVSYKNELDINGSIKKVINEIGTCSKKDWIPFEWNNYDFKEDIDYLIRIEGRKAPMEKIDWVQFVDKAKLDKWEWWNPTLISSNRNDYAFYETGDITANGTTNNVNQSSLNQTGGWLFEEGQWFYQNNFFKEGSFGIRANSTATDFFNYSFNTGGLDNFTLFFDLYDDTSVNTDFKIGLFNTSQQDSTSFILSIGIHQDNTLNYTIQERTTNTYHNLSGARTNGWHNLSILDRMQG